MIHEKTFCIVIWQSPIVITPPSPPHPPPTLATIHLLFYEIYKHITYYDPRTDFLYYNQTIPHRDDTPPSSLSIDCVVVTIHILFCEIYKQITYYVPGTDSLYYNTTILHRDYTLPPWLPYTYSCVKSTNTLPTMIHEQTFCIITWQSPIVITPPWIQCTYSFVKSANTLPTMIHEKSSCNIIWQSPIVMTLPPPPISITWGWATLETSTSTHTVLPFNCSADIPWCIYKFCRQHNFENFKRNQFLCKNIVIFYALKIYGFILFSSRQRSCEGI